MAAFSGGFVLLLMFCTFTNQVCIDDLAEIEELFDAESL